MVRFRCELPQINARLCAKLDEEAHVDFMRSRGDRRRCVDDELFFIGLRKCAICLAHLLRSIVARSQTRSTRHGDNAMQAFELGTTISLFAAFARGKRRPEAGVALSVATPLLFICSAWFLNLQSA